MFHRHAFAVLALAGASVAVQAHDIVLVPQAGGGLAVRYGHPQDWQVLEKSKLIDLQAYDGQATARDLLAAMKPNGLAYALPANVVAPNKPLLLAARYDNGLWARLPKMGDAKPAPVNTTRLMLPAAELVTNNLKFAKALMATAGDEGLYKRQLGHLLELVPQSNPALLKPGEPLDVLVLLQGKPLPGAGIEVGNLVDAVPEDQIRRYTTDAAGIARVTLRARGVNMLGVDVEMPNDGRLGEASRQIGADKFVLVATYTFLR